MNVMSKKNVLVLSVVGLFVIFLLGYFQQQFDFCYYSNENGHSGDFCETGVMMLLPFLPILLLSLITYKMRDEVFEHWMKFAVWGTPMLIILTYLLSTAGGGGGMGVGSAMSSSFDALLYFLLCGTFCGISMWRIGSKNRQLKHGGK